MKRLILILLFCGLTSAVNAQWLNSKPVQKFEAELRFSMAWPYEMLRGFENDTEWCGAFEFRYNFREKPIDLGLEIDVTELVLSACNPPRGDGGIYYDTDRGLVSLLAVSDYNFKRASKFNPFAGGGVGISYQGRGGSKFIVDDNGRWHDSQIQEEYLRPVYELRAGVELLYHIRLMFRTQFTTRGYSNYGFSIGFVLGGRPSR